MPRMTITHSVSILGIATAALLAACTDQPAPVPADSGQAVAEPASTPAAGPAGTVPPPASMPPDGDTALASFLGYGEIAFGTAAADMEAAWGGKLAVLGKEYNASCYFMNPTWAKVPAEFNFMIGDGRFVRFGTESERFTAPGGGRKGMTRAQLAGLYPELGASPHAYTDGEYLQVADPAGGKAVLIFETDGKGDDARVTEWRIGTPPHVGYVEGCA